MAVFSQETQEELSGGKESSAAEVNKMCSYKEDIQKWSLMKEH